MKNDTAELFLKKSKESRKAAKELEQLCLKDSAVNRYYYSLYQLILSHIDFEVENTGFASHKNTIKKFFNPESKTDHNPTQVEKNFQSLREYRNNADYKKESISDDDFETFKDIFNDVLSEIEKLLPIIIRKQKNKR